MWHSGAGRRPGWSHSRQHLKQTTPSTHHSAMDASVCRTPLPPQRRAVLCGSHFVVSGLSLLVLPHASR